MKTMWSKRTKTSAIYRGKERVAASKRRCLRATSSSRRTIRSSKIPRWSRPKDRAKPSSRRSKTIHSKWRRKGKGRNCAEKTFK